MNDSLARHESNSEKKSDVQKNTSADQWSVAIDCLDKVELTTTHTNMSVVFKCEDLIKQIPLVKSYMQLPPQHPIRFLGLCAKVFFYFLAYGYLQVCLLCRM